MTEVNNIHEVYVLHRRCLLELTNAEFSSTRNDIVVACKRDIQIAISLESH